MPWANTLRFRYWWHSPKKTLNVSLPNAYKIREEVLNRKTKSTDFLERLIDALIEKSAK